MAVPRAHAGMLGCWQQAARPSALPAPSDSSSLQLMPRWPSQSPAEDRSRASLKFKGKQDWDYRTPDGAACLRVQPRPCQEGSACWHASRGKAWPEPTLPQLAGWVPHNQALKNP